MNKFSAVIVSACLLLNTVQTGASGSSFLAPPSVSDIESVLASGTSTKESKKTPIISKEDKLTPMYTEKGRLRIVDEFIATNPFIDLRHGLHTVLDIGVGYPAYPTIELAEKLAEINQRVKVVGTDVFIPAVVVEHKHNTAFFDRQGDLVMVLLSETEQPIGNPYYYGERLKEIDGICSKFNRLKNQLERESGGKDYGEPYTRRILFDPFGKIAEQKPNVRFIESGFDLPDEIKNVSLIRVFNTLGYYNDYPGQQLDAVMTLGRVLVEGGILIAGRTDMHGNYADYVVYQKIHGRLIPKTIKLDSGEVDYLEGFGKHYYAYLRNSTDKEDLYAALRLISRPQTRLIIQTPEELSRSNVECDLRKRTDREELKVLSRIMLACWQNELYGKESRLFTEILVIRKKTPVRFKIAYRMSKAKEMMLALDEKQDKKLTIEVVFAVLNTCKYRMMKPHEHPDGEDSLREKIRQLEDLFEGMENFDWRLRIVDDGSRIDTGEYALQILQKEYPRYLEEGKIVVNFLEQAIKENLKRPDEEKNPVLSGMKSARDSIKGGAINYGMYEAARRGSDIVVFTDSDNSSLLYFIGDVLWHLIESNFDAALGSRAMPDSIVLNRGIKKLIQSWPDTILFNWFVIKPLMPRIREIRDTQNGFKGFWADTLLNILPKTQIRGAIFDVELIYLSKVFGRRNGVKEFGMPWIDNPGVSNFSIKDGFKMRRDLKERASSIINTFLNQELIDELDKEDKLSLLKDPAVSNAMAENAVKDAFRFGQEHIFKYWTELSTEEKEELLRNVQLIDFEKVDRFYRDYVLVKGDIQKEEEDKEIIPEVTIPEEEAEKKWGHLADESLKNGEVAVYLLAGGSGSRLGFDKPKGCFEASPLSGKTLYQIFAERVKVLSERYGKPIPLIIQTSEDTHEETVAYFKKNNYFGIKEQIRFEKQRSFPPLDKNGKVVMTSKSSISLGGFGHGEATDYVLKKKELRKWLKDNFGTKYVQIVQIDNPLAPVGNKALLGAHIASWNQKASKDKVHMTFTLMDKKSPKDRLGNLALVDGEREMIEYTDMSKLPPETSEKFKTGSPNILVVSLDSLEYAPPLVVPHVADKKVDDLHGQKVDVAKFEFFIFDHMNYGAAVKLKRNHIFASIKNKERNKQGAVVPESRITSQSIQSFSHGQKLRSLGWNVPGTFTLGEKPEIEIYYPCIEFTDEFSLSDEGGVEARIGRDGRFGKDQGALFLSGRKTTLGDNPTINGGLYVDVEDEKNGVVEIGNNVTFEGHIRIKVYGTGKFTIPSGAKITRDITVFDGEVLDYTNIDQEKRRSYEIEQFANMVFETEKTRKAAIEFLRDGKTVIDTDAGKIKVIVSHPRSNPNFYSISLYTMDEDGKLQEMIGYYDFEYRRSFPDRCLISDYSLEDVEEHNPAIQIKKDYQDKGLGTKLILFGLTFGAFNGARFHNAKGAEVTGYLKRLGFERKKFIGMDGQDYYKYAFDLRNFASLPEREELVGAVRWQSAVRAVEAITSEDDEDEKIRNTTQEDLFEKLNTEELLAEAQALEELIEKSDNLYHKVRACALLNVIYGIYLYKRDDVKDEGSVDFAVLEHMGNRRFEEAIKLLHQEMEEKGHSKTLFTYLAATYDELMFEYLKKQVENSIHALPENKWMFEVKNLDEYETKVKVLKAYLTPDRRGRYPVLHIAAPVRIELASAVASDIFFLAMDRPEKAKVINISADLAIWGSGKKPAPPINVYMRVIDEPVIRLRSVDLGKGADVKSLEELFDFSDPNLSVLKAAVVASGLVPFSFKGRKDIKLEDLLARLLGKERLGFEFVTHVHAAGKAIPRGSGLAVSTMLLVAGIDAGMKFSGQMKYDDERITEGDKITGTGRTVFGEWLGGSGGGWQDSAGQWGGIKLCEARVAMPGDPEYGVSRGRLLPKFETMREVGKDTEKNLVDSMVLVHCGACQDVGPVLMDVTRAYLTRKKDAWKARLRTEKVLEDQIENLRRGDIKSIGKLETDDWINRITIVPLGDNAYIDKIVRKLKKRFGKDFWGADSTGCRGGAGHLFFVNPERKEEFIRAFNEVVSDVRSELRRDFPIPVDPVVYDFNVNDQGIKAHILTGAKATVPGEKNIIVRSITKLLQVSKLIRLRIIRKEEELPDTIQKALTYSKASNKAKITAYKSGKISLKNNRKWVSSVESAKRNDLILRPTEKTKKKAVKTLGSEALKKGEVGELTLAAGVGVRLTGGETAKPAYPILKIGTRYYSFMHIQGAKTVKVAREYGVEIPHICYTGHATEEALRRLAKRENNFGLGDNLIMAQALNVSQKAYPTEEDLRYARSLEAKKTEREEELRKDQLKADIDWSKSKGEGDPFIPEGRNKLNQFNPPGHFYWFSNVILSGALGEALAKQPNLKYLFVHNIDNLLATIDEETIGLHIGSGKAISAEVSPVTFENKGGGLYWFTLSELARKTLGIRKERILGLLEGLGCPDIADEFKTEFFNVASYWITLDKVFKEIGITRKEVIDIYRGAQEAFKAVQKELLEFEKRVATYVTIKPVIEDYGLGRRYDKRIAQFEKFWGDVSWIIPFGYILSGADRSVHIKEIAHRNLYMDRGLTQYLLPELPEEMVRTNVTFVLKEILEAIPPASESSVKLVIFDWGNVITRYDYRLAAKELAKYFGVNEDVAFMFFEERNTNPDNILYKYEKGKINEEQLREGIRNWLKQNSSLGKIELTKEKFEEIYNSIWMGDIPETIALIKDLKEKGYKIRILTTSNSIHHAYDLLHSAVVPLLENGAKDIYASHLRGVSKPDKRSYLEIVNDGGVSPEQCLFIDDRQDCVDGAIRAGLISYRFNPDDIFKSVKGVAASLSTARTPHHQKDKTTPLGILKKHFLRTSRVVLKAL